MPTLWPIDWNKATFSGSLADVLGQVPTRARLYIKPNITGVLTSLGSKTAVLSTEREISTDAITGGFNVSIPATNDPNVNPTDFTYRVRITMGTAGVGDIMFDMEAPMGQDVGLIDSLNGSVIPSSGRVRVTAYEYAVLAGFVGTESEYAASITPAALKGAQGIQGVPGPANSLAIGTVETGEAAASITGSAPSQTLNLTLQQGIQGVQGVQGVVGPTGPANVLTIGTVTTGTAAASITGTAPAQMLNLTVPQGVAGPPNSLAAGTVTTGAPGSSASATVTGSAPNQVLNLTIPRGDTGPVNTLSAGTVTTGDAGSPAIVTVTGTAPSQVINMTIPQGLKGDTGPVGPAGPTGYALNSSQVLATALDFGLGALNIAVASDSTGNDATIDWPWQFQRKLADAAPSNLRIEYKDWDATALAWRSPSVMAAGVAGVSSGGMVLSDDFNRTGTVAGSSPQIGPAWTSTGSAVWSADGSLASATAATGYLTSPLAGSVAMTSTTVFSLVTKGTGATQTIRVYSPSDGANNSIWGTLILSAPGALSAGLYKTIGGVTTKLATCPIVDILSNSATAQSVTMVVTLNNLDVSMSLQKTGGTLNTCAATITDTEYAGLGRLFQVFAGTAGTPGFRLDSVSVDTPLSPAPPTPGVWMANASASGQTLEYQRTRIATLWPSGADILVISHGHNYGAQTGAQFVAGVESFLADWQAQFSTLPRVLIISENPQYGIASAPLHAARQAAIRQWALSKGHQYVGAFEAITKAGAEAMTKADGVHPTTPPAGTTTGAYGTVLWADTWMATVTAARLAS